VAVSYAVRRLSPRFWGDNLLRLDKMKQRVSPANVFGFPMSVPMTPLVLYHSVPDYCTLPGHADVGVVGCRINLYV